MSSAMLSPRRPIIPRITKNIRPHTGLLGLKGHLEGSLKPQAIDEAAIAGLDKAIAALGSFISDNSLSAAYNSLIAAHGTPAKSTVSAPTVEQLQTPKNSFALVGADDDMVLLFNASRLRPA
jgi:hypothetical protein